MGMGLSERQTDQRVRIFSPITSILDSAYALRFVAEKLDDEQKYGPACVLFTLSEQLREVAEKMDDQEWLPTKPNGPYSV